MNRETTCLLCGIVSHDVTIGLARWVEPIGRDRFGAVPRCRDKVSCRGRVEATGERWDVLDAVRPTVELVK